MASVSELFSLRGKVALVTGGYGGIGMPLCKALAEAGAAVAIAGHNAEKTAALAGEMAASGHSAAGFPFDALSPAETRHLADKVVEKFGRVDILINTVGLNREQRAEEVTEDQFDLVFATNLKSAMFQSQAVARHFISQGQGGKILHFGSLRTLLGLRGRGYAAYCATKGGLAILAKQLAAEWAPHKINVNVVAPTFVRTEQVAKMLADDTFRSALEARIPLGRIAEPQDMVGAVLYFVSAASDFVTGQTLYLDGGITATQ